jgi:putative Mg2+ transporter-C (MgtC) family protein
MPWVEFCFRLVLALILGCLIGFERQWRQRTAGMRTNTLVALGSVLFVLMGMMSQGEASPARIAAAVATGIGFLGAGVSAVSWEIVTQEEI